MVRLVKIMKMKTIQHQQSNLRHAFPALKTVLVILMLLAGFQLTARSEELDQEFPVQGGANGAVYASALQPDGKILIGGAFTKINGKNRPYLARLNSDSTLDAAFQPPAGITNAVYSIALQPDGKIVVAGAFNRTNGSLENRILRLNADGSRDESFAPGSGANGTVRAVALQPDGKLLLGGSFTSFNGVSSNRLVRLNSDGSVDQSFAPAGGADASVETIAADASGRVVIGGAFKTVNNVSRSGVARLNGDGSLDLTFNPGSGTAERNPGDGSHTVYSIVVQPDGRILLGGAFYSFNGTPRPAVLRLDVDGTLDTAFNLGTGVDGAVRTATILSDGRVLIGGAFSIFSPATRDRIARLNLDGSVDSTFNTQGMAGEVYVLAVQPDSKLVIGGSFTGINYALRSRIARLNADGSLDRPFAPTGGANGNIYKIVAQPDGKILLGGEFTAFNGIPRRGIVRLNADGSVDNSFDSAIGINEGNYSRIDNIIVLPDGKILIGGEFDSFNGVNQKSLARLNPDGSVDASFVGSLTVGKVNALVRQPDGKILVGGNFGGINGNNQTNFARLDPNGNVDTGFLMGAGPNSYVSSIVLQPDGKILLGGDFYKYNNITQEKIARLNPDGSLDASFNVGGGPQGAVYGLLLQPDGKVLVRGFFENVNGVQRIRIARLNADGSLDQAFNPGAGPYGVILDFALQGDGKILIGGTFSSYNNVARNKLARLNPDGSLDGTLIQGNGPNGDVRAFWIQPDRSILIGGSFSLYSGVSTTNLIRLKGVNRPPADFDGDGKTDISIFRPADGSWWYSRSLDNAFRVFSFGISSDIITPGDYTGDGKTDLGVFRPSTGEWFVQRSEDNSYFSFPFGSNGDIPAPADYDADGKTDAAVFRPSTGTWYILNSGGSGTSIVQFGADGDFPVAADYDGDGRADIALFRPSDGSWWYLQSSNAQFRVYRFGESTDKPVPGDYTGDGKADIAVWRPASGEWFFKRSEDDSYFSVPFGAAGDIVAPGDYDGDGRFDTAVFRPSTANWFVQRSTAGILITTFGAAGDRPVTNAFVP